MACLHYSLSLDFLVEKPKGKYNGQKLMVLVIKNTAPRINKIVARSPEIIYTLPAFFPVACHSSQAFHYPRTPMKTYS